MSYVYGKLEDKLIDLLKSGEPDFTAAEELIQAGADLNAMGEDDSENILSEILIGYWHSQYESRNSEVCCNCEEGLCIGCEHNINTNPNLGASMCAIIQFFLDHGFDVTKCDDCFGAQCLHSLTLSSFDRYMIKATKMLLDAGAKNRTIRPSSTDSYETPRSWIATEASYQCVSEHDFPLANLYEAVYEVYLAAEEGRPYRGIDSYEIAVGKKIEKVLAVKDESRPIFFPVDTHEFKQDNCYIQNLYFIYEGGFLVANQYCDFWTDTTLPDVEYVDVSDQFKYLIGGSIERFDFGYKSIIKGKTHYTQPITIFEMDTGNKIKFSINFGEVDDEHRAGYIEHDLSDEELLMLLRDELVKLLDYIDIPEPKQIFLASAHKSAGSIRKMISYLKSIKNMGIPEIEITRMSRSIRKEFNELIG